MTDTREPSGAVQAPVVDFDNRDELLIDRKPNRHTTFGPGVHRSLGSNIARVEFDVILQEVLRRIPDYVVDEAAAKRYETVGVVNGWERMPFSFTPGPQEGATLKL
jgi:cytochrome P450